MFNIGSWNVRGLGSGPKFSYIKKFIDRNDLCLYGLVETKHKEIDRKTIRRLWGNDDFEWCDVAANSHGSGFSGVLP